MPLVEDRTVDPEDDAALAILQLGLSLRCARALRHWDGDTEVTIGSLMRTVVARTLAPDANE